MRVNFYFKVNETCLHGDHNIFMVAPNDRDAHNPILVHLDPSDMSWNERHHYKQANQKMKYAATRKERQKEKKRKAYEDQASTDQGNTGWGGSSSSSTSRTSMCPIPFRTMPEDPGLKKINPDQ